MVIPAHGKGVVGHGRAPGQAGPADVVRGDDLVDDIVVGISRGGNGDAECYVCADRIRRLVLGECEARLGVADYIAIRSETLGGWRVELAGGYGLSDENSTVRTTS